MAKAKNSEKLVVVQRGEDASDPESFTVVQEQFAPKKPDAGDK